jgi:AraC family ethanolamine operon transcriptional activator
MVNSGSKSLSPTAIVHKIFHDIDELEVVSRANSQRDVRLIQLSLEQLQCEYYMADLGEIRMTFAITNCPIRCTGSKVKGHIDFSCVLDQRQPTLILHGYRTSHATLSGMDTNLETDMLLPPDQVFFTLQVKRDLVESCAEALNREDLITRNWQDNFVYAPETLPQVQDFLRELLTVMQQRPGFLQQPHCRTLVLEDLLPLVIGALPLQTNSTQGLETVRSATLLKAAEAYIQDHLEHPLTVKALAEVLNISKRSLFYNFNAMFGIGPMAYLKVHRLRAVRLNLLTAEPGLTTVAETAQRFGFWSLGHFARDYKTMFGETPRETLKKTE